MDQLIDWRQVLTQILGFIIMLWILRRFAWAPVLKLLEDRRQKIAGEFAEAERRQKDADAAKAKFEQELRGIEALRRQAITEAIAEGQKVAGEIREQANTEAAARLERGQDEIAREREKAKEILKQHTIGLALRAAEKILREKLDESHQRKLIGEFIDEVSATR